MVYVIVLVDEFIGMESCNFHYLLLFFLCFFVVTTITINVIRKTYECVNVISCW